MATGGVVAWNAAFCAVELALLDWSLRADHSALADLSSAGALRSRLQRRDLRRRAGGRGRSGQTNGAPRPAPNQNQSRHADDAARLEAVRKAVGRRCRTARRRQRRLERGAGGGTVSSGWRRSNLQSIEQPVAADDIAGMKQVRDRCGIPVMADESLVTARTGAPAHRAERLRSISISGFRNAAASPAVWRSPSLRKRPASRSKSAPRSAKPASCPPPARTFAAHMPELACAEGSFGTWLLSRRHHLRKRRLRPRRPRAAAENPRLERHGEGRSLGTSRHRERRSAPLRCHGSDLKAAAFLTGRQWTRWENLTAEPARIQNQLLLDIIWAQSRHAFGQDHRFAAIGYLATIASRSPSATTNGCALMSSAPQNGEVEVLTEEPVLMFTLDQRQHRRAQADPGYRRHRARNHRQLTRFWYYRAYLDHPELFSGKLLGVVSPAVEGQTAGGIPFGAASGLIYQSSPRWIQNAFALPYEIAEVKDFAAKYYLIMRLALEQRHYVFRHAQSEHDPAAGRNRRIRNKYEIIRDIRDGTISARCKFPERCGRARRASCRKNPARARPARMSGEPRRRAAPQGLLAATAIDRLLERRHGRSALE